MTTGSLIQNTQIPSLLFAEQGSDPSTPDTDFWRLFFKSGGLYAINDAGSVVGPFASSSSSAGGSTLQSVTRTAGNLTLAANTSTHTEVSSALRLTLPASTGDVLLIGVASLLTQGGTGEAILDSATIVSSAIVNQCSPGTKHVGHGYTNAALRSVGATITYPVVSGDISGGNVVVSLTYINSDGASTGLLRAASDYALHYWALNLGH